MDLDGRELVGIAFVDDSGHLCEVFGDLLGGIEQNHGVFGLDFLQELRVRINVCHQGFWHQFRRKSGQRRNVELWRVLHLHLA